MVFVFKKKYNFNLLEYPPILEEKTTGNIKFYNLNNYFHVCKTCNVEYKYDKNVIHVCN